MRFYFFQPFRLQNLCGARRRQFDEPYNVQCPLRPVAQESSEICNNRYEPGAIGFFRFSQDGQIDNRRQLMRALESACVDRGVHFQEGVEVLKLLHDNNQLKGARIRDSEGTELTVSAETAVLCSGAWSAELMPELPVFPVKGQMLSLQTPKGALKRVIFGPGTYLVPRDDAVSYTHLTLPTIE